jgi:Protein of unknown function (DUF1592)/Protein of unknown function (DUF1588)/Protein of unknown function (DUF1595)/Protein of unknown function (DUF1587)/Protein of unknown function (DUF1585)
VLKRSSLGAWFSVALGGLAACTGQIGGDELPPGSDPNGPTVEGFEPPAPTMRRLLARQYLNAIGDLLGPEAKAAATAPADSPLNGFDMIGAAQLNVGDVGVVDYEKSARAAASAAVDDGSRVGDYLSCTPSGPTDEACLDTFVHNFGRLAFRRTLTDDEAADIVAVGMAAGEAYSSFDQAIQYSIATALQSPSFVYQVEVGDALAGDPTVRKLTPNELATRMSFFLVDSTPSAELLDLAESGGLDSSEDLRAAAEMLVARPEAAQAVGAMYDEILGLRALPTITKSSDLYPEFSPALAASMRQETLNLLSDVVFTRNADFAELFTSDHTFVDEGLANLYGVTPPAAGEWQEVTFPADQPRSGFFGQASFLSTQAHIELTSPTLRGKFVRERLLCQSINPPPNNVITEFPDNEGLKTMRERLEFHQENPSCAGCHALTDPIGLSFENFDSIGRYRLTENDVTIDPSGELDDSGDFANGAELADLLVNDPGFTACLVRNVYRASLGHLETDGEEVVVDQLVEGFDDDGRRLKAFLVELVVSDGFRFVGAEQ